MMSSSRRTPGPIATDVSLAKIAPSISFYRGRSAVWVPDRRSLALTCPGRRGVSFGFNCQTARGCASAFSRRAAPELCFDFRPQETRGRREDRVRAAPAVSRAMLLGITHTSIQVQREHPGLPCAMALRLTSCSPRRTALLPPSPREKLSLLPALTTAPRRPA